MLEMEGYFPYLRLTIMR